MMKGVFVMNINMLEKMKAENEAVFYSQVDAYMQTMARCTLFNIKQTILDAGIDIFIFDSMKKDLINGNFGVLYLDDRIVGEDKKRQKAQKLFNRLRKQLNTLKNNGVSPLQIILT